ncbi:hypothetical protein [Anaeroselena agilis]|uniref:Uncharacterized protein n=1 Tax=Anaeroselena agilis TaxID=3063788 RepID=A0ABU3NZE6_9FIRM|nr:hypothetical protein [Selenomonadales bacterium 4137-cl]
MKTLILAAFLLAVGLMMAISCFCAMAMELDVKQNRIVQILVWISGLMIGTGLVMLALASEY